MYVSQKNAQLGADWGAILKSAGPNIVAGLKDVAGKLIGAQKDRDIASVQAKQASIEAEKNRNLIVYGGMAVLAVVAVSVLSKPKRGKNARK